jgi:hypothetical protein
LVRPVAAPVPSLDYRGRFGQRSQRITQSGFEPPHFGSGEGFDPAIAGFCERPTLVSATKCMYSA